MAEGLLGLLFELSADPSKAQAAMAELRASSIAESGEISKIWSTAMNAITGPTGIALGGMVALGGGMLEAANKAAEMGDKIYEASEKTGMSAETLSGVAALSKEMGKNFESLSASFARATVNIAKAADTGKGEIASLFTTAQRESLKLKPVDEQMQTVLHRIFQLTEEGERNRALQALMGRGWQENIGILKMLATEGYGPAIEQAKKLHIYYDDKAAQQAHAYGIEMRTLKGELSGIALGIGRELLPHFSEWLVELHTVNYEVQLLGIGLQAQALSLVNVGGIFDKELDKLATKATEVWVAEHLALQKLRDEMKDTAKALQDSGVAGGKPDLRGLREAANEEKDYNRAIEHQLEIRVKLAKELRDAAASADTETTADRRWITAHEQVIAIFQKEWSWYPKLDAVVRSLTPAVVAQTEAVQKASVVFRAHAEAAHLAAVAESYMTDVAEQFATGLAALIGGRRAQAGVEAVWETARGIALLAEGAWPPNPAAIFAAGIHFEAAAQYAMLAGTSSRHRGGAGAGSYGSSSVDRGSAGGGTQAPSQQRLAPGAAPGSGGRFGEARVVVFGTDHELQNWVAGAINGAVQRGVSVTATSSQRGAPVGH
jgi:hypothetical protein